MKDIDVGNTKSESAAPSERAETLATVEAGTANPEQLGELMERAAKADENWDRLLRTAADFDNYKKRAAREKQEATRYANEALLQKLIPVLDNLDVALASAQAAPGQAVESLQTGINMIQQQLRNALKETGLEEINAVGQPFDPNLHEAVSQRECKDVPEGQVVQQLRKGYRFRERLLRPATVIVAKPLSA